MKPDSEKEAEAALDMGFSRYPNRPGLGEDQEGENQ